MVAEAVKKLKVSLKGLGIGVVLEKSAISPSGFSKDTLQSNRKRVRGVVHHDPPIDFETLGRDGALSIPTSDEIAIRINRFRLKCHFGGRHSRFGENCLTLRITSRTDRPLPDTYRTLASLFGAAAAALGLLGLSGWVLGIPLLASIRSSYIPMAPITSVSFLSLGGVLLVHSMISPQDRAGMFAAALSALISAYGLVELVEGTGVRVLSLEERLFPDPPMMGAVFTGRMSPSTAVILLLSGAVVPMLVLRARIGRSRRFPGDLAGCLGMIVAAVGAVFVLGYLHGHPLLYGTSTIPMAATTSLAVLMLGAGQVLAAGPDCFPLRVFAGPSTRARLLRAFVTTTVGIVLAIDLLRVYAPWIFFEDDPFLSGVSIAAITLVTGALIARVALKLADDMDRSEEHRKLAEEKLRESEDRYRDLVEHSQDLICTHDLEGRILSVNPRVSNVLGYAREELLRMNIREILTPNARPLFGEYLDEIRAHGAAQGLLSVQSRNGEQFLWEYKNSLRTEGVEKPVVRGMAQDVTERRKLEQRLLQSQRLEAVGRLAGGIAHDFNNLLTVINGYSELLLDRMKEESPLRKEVEEIKRSGERAATLTRQLLAFSRQQVMQPKVLDLNEAVFHMDMMLRRLIGEDVEFRTVLGSDLWSVKADPGLLDQVVMNLVVNARDAMPGGGKLTIETSNVLLDEEYSHLHPPVRPGPFVMLAITDTGVGMDEKTASQVFEPFYTTKERGKGTGLGLSTVYGIVKQSGGFIWAYSEPGKGSTFKVYLPRTEDRREVPDRGDSPVEDLRGENTVLVVEDEEPIRKLAVTVLEQYGYAVLSAGDGEEALRIAAGHEGEINLLLTDVVMPRLGGRELYERLHQLRPGIKVLYMSGYTDNAIVHQGMLDPGISFLQKPCSPASLVRKVKEVLKRS